MIEVLWHGRGGQGAFTAARLLGAAASLQEGRHALAFPSFGPERRGAPMRAFTKLDGEPIGDRSAIAHADYVVYLDDTLLTSGWENELKPGGMVLVNSAHAFSDERIVAIDADGISQAILGRPIPNTVFLGALSALCDQVAADDVKEAIRQYMAPKLHEKNMRIVDEAAAVMAQREPAPAASANGIAAPEKTGDGTAVENASMPNGTSPRPDSRIPALRATDLDPRDYARSTCYEAGHLVSKNAGWRNLRPVIDQATCTGCLQCYLYCPDGTIFKTTDASSASPVAIDLDFCKGCGICVTVCKAGSITMISEKEALAAQAAATASAPDATTSAPAHVSRETSTTTPGGTAPAPAPTTTPATAPESEVTPR